MIIKDLTQIKEMPLGRGKDLSKNQYNGFKAIKRIEPILSTKDRAANWLCLCDCGNYFASSANNLNRGTCKSCGCLQKKKAGEILSTYQKNIKGKPKTNYIGYKSGKLTVIDFSHIDKNRHSVWKCQCECGNIVDVASPELAKKDIKSCGCLKQSYGSYKIEQILITNNIKFEKEKTFDTCRFPESNALARFDFYINGKLVEFDGKQHYEYVGGYFSMEDFHKLQARDEFKNNWCQKNNIELIRVPYYDEDKISLDYLKQKGIIL